MFLLDTNVFIRYQVAPEKLSKAIIEIIKEQENQLYISSVVAWEISIKTAKGKLQIAESVLQTYSEILLQMQIKEVAIIGQHTITAGALPAIHQDPFDRLIIAQATLLGLTVLTTDRTFELYNISVIN